MDEQEFVNLSENDVPSFNEWRLTEISVYLFEWFWNVGNENSGDWYAVNMKYNKNTDSISVTASTYNEKRGMGDLISAQDYQESHNNIEDALNTVEEFVEKIETERP